MLVLLQQSQELDNPFFCICHRKPPEPITHNLHLWWLMAEHLLPCNTNCCHFCCSKAGEGQSTGAANKREVPSHGITSVSSQQLLHVSRRPALCEAVAKGNGAGLVQLYSVSSGVGQGKTTLTKWKQSMAYIQVPRLQTDYAVTILQGQKITPQIHK